jgi:ribosomal-protein-alanine N-acetyltransferase
MIEGKAFPELETRRLLLREMTTEDAPAVFQFRSDPEVQRYNGGAVAEIREAADLIEELAEGFRKGMMVQWGVTLKPRTETVIGIFGYANWGRLPRHAEIGYCLARPYWRQGIATEGLRCILAYGFGPMDLNRVHACPWAENVASVRLLEKLGFRCEGMRREEYWADGAFHDEALYGLLQREYAPIEE